MRWAGSLRRSEACRSGESRPGIEPNGFGQPGLPVVEGPEALGFQFEGACHVERIEGPNAKCGSVILSERDPGLPYPLWQTNRDPDSSRAILLKFAPSALSLECRELLAEDVLLERVNQFSSIEGSNPNRRKCAHSADCFRRMNILYVIGDQEAGIGADGQ